MGAQKSPDAVMCAVGTVQCENPPPPPPPEVDGDVWNEQMHRD